MTSNNTIAFIVGSAEPGSSGVGDYARIISQELYKNDGSKIHIIALREPRLKGEIKQYSENNINFTRIPSDVPYTNSLPYIRRILEQPNLGLLSLQYVGYAYDRLGTAYPLIKLLKQIKLQCQVEIMFHELWEGFGIRDSFKTRLKGVVQKQSVKKLIKTLQPRICHTQNLFYLHHLQSLTPKSKYLPLFGNIKISPKNSDLAYSIIRNRTSLDLNTQNRESLSIFAFFGSIYPGWPIDECIEQIKQFAQKKQKNAVILSLGSLGKNRQIWDKMKQDYSEKIQFHEIGFLDENEVSVILQEIDFGLASTPFEGMEKSGAYVTMKEHGKIVFGGNNMLKHFDGFSYKGEIQCQPMNRLYDIASNPPTAPHFGSLLPGTVEQFTNDLNQNKKSSCKKSKR